MSRGFPSRERKNVVAGSCLPLGLNGQKIFEAVRGDVVDLNVDLFLLAPFLTQLGQGVVGPGHPVIPKAKGQASGGIGASDEWCSREHNGPNRGRSYELPA